MIDKFTEQDAALLDELGHNNEPKKVAQFTPRQERVISGFADIQRFVDTHGRSPERSGNRDFLERLYAVRLDKIRRLTEDHDLLAPLDYQGLLSSGAEDEKSVVEALDDEKLLAELGIQPAKNDIKTLRPCSFERRETGGRGNCKSYEVQRVRTVSSSV